MTNIVWLVEQGRTEKEDFAFTLEAPTALLYSPVDHV